MTQASHHLRIMHVMAVLGLLTIIAINVDWVMARADRSDLRRRTDPRSSPS